MNRVRNVLFRSSIVGLTTSSSSTKGSTARRTVVLKPRSMSVSGEASAPFAPALKSVPRIPKLTLLDLFVRDDDLLLSVCLGFGGGKRVYLVRAFRAPRDIVQVAEGVDILQRNRQKRARADVYGAQVGHEKAHEDVREGRRDQEELRHRMQQVPRLEVE